MKALHDIDFQRYSIIRQSIVVILSPLDGSRLSARGCGYNPLALAVTLRTVCHTGMTNIHVGCTRPRGAVGESGPAVSAPQLRDTYGARSPRGDLVITPPLYVVYGPSGALFAV